MRSRIALACICALAAIVATGADPRAAHAQTCPDQAFLTFGHVVYVQATPPADASARPSLARGAEVGAARLDFPSEDDPCKRRVEDVAVQRLGTADPAVLVAVKGRTDIVFTVGSRCLGFEEDERWSCFAEPLVYGGRTYTEAEADVAAGSVLGPAELAGEPVEVVALAGVDPAVAVGLDGRPGRVYLSSGVCPYERELDLATCLRGPGWLVFDPPGIRTGAPVTAYADRTLPAGLAGAQLELVPIDEPRDELPADRTGAIAVGVLQPAAGGEAALSFAAPTAATGFYEAVARCPTCGAGRDGATEFPLGSLLLIDRENEPASRDWGKIVFLVLFLLFACALVGAIVMYRSGRRFRRRRPEA